MAIITRLGLYGGPRAPYPGFVAADATAVVSGTAVAGGVLESEIVAGGETIVITLANDTWVAAGATFNAQRQAIIDGLDSDGVEAAGWNAEVRDKEVVGAVVRTSDTVVTITLTTAAAGYIITADETITVTVPAAAVTGAAEITATPTFDVTNEVPTAAVAGSVTSATEAEMVAGGRVLTITLTNDVWVDAGASFNAQRQNIIDGLDSAGVEATGWNAEIRDKEVVGSVVRTSNTVVTITFTAAAAYSIESNETITVTVPATALAGGVELTAAPTFSISADAVAQQGGSWLSPEQVRNLERAIREARRDKEGESRRRRQRAEKRISEIERLYDEINGLIPDEPEAVEPIRRAVEPFAASSDARVPPAAAIDWKALYDSAEAVEALVRAMQEGARIRNEDEELILLMMVA